MQPGVLVQSGYYLGAILAAGSTTGSTGTNETRPRNIALLPCLKY